ncbi:MAG: hypothetical protein HY327_11840 [Chloroflexi bacterium]|nr:hypothetical protein [Chloroflexota bacterium]
MANIEVDQSGKIDLSVDTVLAFSNENKRAIRIPTTVKRAGLKFLRQRRVSARIRFLRMLVAGYYILLQRELNRLGYIKIDVEFDSREQDLRGMLLILIWKRYPDFPKDRLTFHRIGKKSPAHRLALATFQGKRRAEKTITEEEFLENLK